MKQFLICQVPNVGDGYVPPKALCTQGLLEETNLFACSPEAVNMYGGVHTREALRQLVAANLFSINRAYDAGLRAVIDVRIHMLHPQQYPAVPGWHCDHVPRGGYSGQPNFGLCSNQAFHLQLSLSDSQVGVSNTEFVMQPIKVCLQDPDHVYRELHREMERIKPLTERMPDGRFIWYNQRSIQRASPAVRRGVRLFMRYSMVEHPVIQNQRDVMPHVYQLAEENGW